MTENSKTTQGPNLNTESTPKKTQISHSFIHHDHLGPRCTTS